MLVSHVYNIYIYIYNYVCTYNATMQTIQILGSIVIVVERERTLFRCCLECFFAGSALRAPSPSLGTQQPVVRQRFS